MMTITNVKILMNAQIIRLVYMSDCLIVTIRTFKGDSESKIKIKQRVESWVLGYDSSIVIQTS